MRKYYVIIWWKNCLINLWELSSTWLQLSIVWNTMIGNQPLLSPLGEGGEVSHGFQGERSGGQSLSSKYEGGGFRKLTASEGVDQVKQNPRTPTPPSTWVVNHVLSLSVLFWTVLLASIEWTSMKWGRGAFSTYPKSLLCTAKFTFSQYSLSLTFFWCFPKVLNWTPLPTVSSSWLFSNTLF